jgi:23S rRNA pseudouridine1911/1915/1917 synthase
MKLEIIYEDEDYVVVNKPSGVLSIPDRHNVEFISIAGLLRERYSNIFIVHRIDKETSGCICFAKMRKPINFFPYNLRSVALKSII